MKNFHDCISTAAMTAVDQDAPDHLLPLLISNQAALLCGERHEDADSASYH